MALLKLVSGVSLIILFSISLFMFMVNFIAQNNPDSLIDSSDPFISSSLRDLQNRSDELTALGESSKNILTSYQPSPVYLFLIIYSAFAIPLGFLAFLIKGTGTVFNLLFVSLFGAGGSPFYLVLGIINAIVLLTIIVIILREVRTGRS